jgi:hypothetical protein
MRCVLWLFWLVIVFRQYDIVLLIYIIDEERCLQLSAIWLTDARKSPSVTLCSSYNLVDLFILLLGLGKQVVAKVLC